MVKEKCKEVTVSSSRLAKKENHFTTKQNIKSLYKSMPKCVNEKKKRKGKRKKLIITKEIWMQKDNLAN